MLTSVRSLSAASLFAIAALSAAPAMAQEDDDGGIGVELSANVALVSEYRFRGVNLSDGDIAIQGGVDIGLPAGFYVGTWASSIDEDTVGYGHTELDIYGGWAGEFGNVSTDVGVIVYLYPNAGPLAGPNGDGATTYAEAYGSVGVGLGPFEATVGTAYAWEQDTLGGNDNFYLYGDLGLGVPGTPVTVTGHVGYTDGFLTFTNDGEAIDYSLTAEAAIPGTPVSVSVAFVGVEGDVAIDPLETYTGDTVVVSLMASF